MQADRHAPRVRRAFFVEHVELVDDHVAEGLRRNPEIQERRNIVQFDRVRHGDQVLVGGVEPEWMVVCRVITQILDAILLEQSRRVVRVRQEGAQPTLGLAPKRLLHRIQHGLENLPLALLAETADDLAIRVGDVANKVGRGVIDAVSDPGPVAFLALLDDPWIFADDLSVQAHGAAHAARIHQVHHAPQANAVAVIAPSVVQRVGAEHRRARYQSGALDRGREVLDVDVRHDRHARSVRQLERLAVDDRHEIVVLGLCQFSHGTPLYVFLITRIELSVI